eukprot:GHVP01052903.1.p1 GENE.GHVP01052903.1~~GHVP01052903.1.p1  ORF type:complete len:381 (-),score=59.79 GHVP01052903.1:101-1243(-)
MSNIIMDPYKGMKALILAGGFGTRLRPLTLTVPKPLVPFANKPMILHQIENLAFVGVKEIILAVSYKVSEMEDQMKQYETEYNVKITFSVEETPLDTGGPLALASKILSESDEPFFVLNSDIMCNYPFQQMIDFHKKHSGEGTLLVTPVKDPSRYGVIVCKDESTEIHSFVEKPKEPISQNINAGIYLLNPSVLKRIPLEKTSIERNVFPGLAKEGKLHAFLLEGYWMDIGLPTDYIKAIPLYLENMKSKKEKNIKFTVIESNGKSKGVIQGEVSLSANVKIGEGCIIGPNVFIGPNVVIGNTVMLKNCAIFEGTTIGNGSIVKNSIIGWNGRIGNWVRIENDSIFGDAVTISDCTLINGGVVLHNKTVSEDIKEPKIVL